MERAQEAKRSKILSKEEVMKLFEEHERRWAKLQTMEMLSWQAFPWPIFKRPDGPDDLTTPAISAYVLSPHHPSDAKKAPKDRIKEHIRRWHPDRFDTKLLPKVREDDRERVKEGAGLVARNLNELLTREAESDSLF
ncbi:hypothetical protein OBBRIDRAFT_742502 [Obba rivulosa]|uniref:Uncharacterized protein n=1 Tax=Obba rivulosa TaxID=1052685 RepID=A0A8E2DDM9_9APHY|nr:hypothetical protein OBBRIDRAFT_742502 [Obba rivulosa]